MFLGVLESKIISDLSMNVVVKVLFHKGLGAPFPSTKHTSLGANFPPTGKSFNESSTLYTSLFLYVCLYVGVYMCVCLCVCVCVCV